MDGMDGWLVIITTLPYLPTSTFRLSSAFLSDQERIITLAGSRQGEARHAFELELELEY